MSRWQAIKMELYYFYLKVKTKPWVWYRNFRVWAFYYLGMPYPKPLDFSKVASRFESLKDEEDE